MNKIMYGLVFLLSLSMVLAAYSEQDFEDKELGIGGHLVDATGNLSVNLFAGWNLVPLAVLDEGAGYSWEDASTCDSSIYDKIWMYSPAKKDYFLLTAREWRKPEGELKKEFTNNYYHAFGSSGWIYTPEDCTLTSHSGAQILWEGYVGQLNEPDYPVNNLKVEDLVLIKGWNLIPVNLRMVVSERPYQEFFEGCGLEKINLWDNRNQEWEFSSKEMVEMVGDLEDPPNVNDLLMTMVVKTSRDCNLAKNFEPKQTTPTQPPAIPS